MSDALRAEPARARRRRRRATSSPPACRRRRSRSGPAPRASRAYSRRLIGELAQQRQRAIAVFDRGVVAERRSAGMRLQRQLLREPAAQEPRGARETRRRSPRRPVRPCARCGSRTPARCAGRATRRRAGSSPARRADRRPPRAARARSPTRSSSVTRSIAATSLTPPSPVDSLAIRLRRRRRVLRNRARAARCRCRSLRRGAVLDEHERLGS